MRILKVLDKDIVHSIILDHLTWKDLSQWDVACLGSCRSEWLCVLNGLILGGMRQEAEGGGGSADKGGVVGVSELERWYRWLGHRGVCVRELPLRLSALAEVLSWWSESSYVGMRSLCVMVDGGEDVFSRTSLLRVQDDFSIFLHRCDCLLQSVIAGEQGVVSFSYGDSNSNQSLAMEVMVCNRSSSCITSKCSSGIVRDEGEKEDDQPTCSLGRRLAVSLLKQLMLWYDLLAGQQRLGQERYFVMGSLSVSPDKKKKRDGNKEQQEAVIEEEEEEGGMCVERLFCHDVCLSFIHQLLSPYLISHCRALKDLVLYRFNPFIFMEDGENGLLGVLRGCPVLESFNLQPANHQFFGSCRIPPLNAVCREMHSLRKIIYDQFSIIVDDINHTISLHYNVSRPVDWNDWEDWLNAVFHLVRRYGEEQKQDYTVSIDCKCCRMDSNAFRVVIEKLSPYLRYFHVWLFEIQESVMVEFMRRCCHYPHGLISLDVTMEGSQLSDETLHAIAHYQANLATLSLQLHRSASYSTLPSSLCFSDEGISRMISSCPRLTSLTIPCGGYQSLVEASRLVNLHSLSMRDLCLGKEEVIRFLFQDDIRWSCSLDQAELTCLDRTMFRLLRKVVKKKYYMIYRHGYGNYKLRRQDDDKEVIYLYASTKLVKSCFPQVESLDQLGR